MNIKAIKSQFPIFVSNADQDRLIYLDNAATTHKPQRVIDAISHFYGFVNGTVHRGVYDLSEQATLLYEGARDKVAEFINASDRKEVVFTSGTTEGINFVADAWAMNHVKPGDEIVITQVEHHANMLPWQRVAQKMGATLRYISLNTQDFLLDDIDISEKIKLVAVTHSSNVLGNVWREGALEKLIAKAHNVGAKVLIDAAQSVPHQKVDVQILQADFLVFSGHKMVAPTGVGVLYIKESLHDDVEPYRVGGSMVHDASFNTAHWQVPPMKFEAGTPPIAQVVGLGAAIDFFSNHVDFKELAKHENALASLAVEGIMSIDSSVVLGSREILDHLLTFYINGIHAHDLAAMLGMRNIAVRAGHHCAQPLAKLLDVESSVRASFYMYNTKEDIEIFIDEVRDIVKTFKSL